MFEEKNKELFKENLDVLGWLKSLYYKSDQTRYI